MLDFTFSMSDGTVDMKLLAFIDPGAFFNFIRSWVASYLSWAAKPNKTVVAVKLANRKVVHWYLTIGGTCFKCNQCFSIE